MKDPRDTITEDKAYYDFVYSDENQEKARRAVELGEERMMKEEPPVCKPGEYKERLNFHKNLYEEFSEIVMFFLPVHRDDLQSAVALAKEYWPDAIVNGTLVDHRCDFNSSIQVVFNQVKYSAQDA